MDQPQRDARDSLMLLASMRLADRPETLRIKVRNLSSGGMMAESPVRAVAGERLTIELRNLGWVAGTVAWVSDNRFGVIFDRAIDCKAARRPIAGGQGASAPFEPVAAIDPWQLRRV